jgi:hypothetical protein
MAAWSETQTRPVVQPARKTLTAGNESRHDHRWARLHQTELGLSAVRTPGAALLLLGNRGLFGSHSAVYDVSQQDCVIAVELAVDAHAVVV